MGQGVGENERNREGNGYGGYVKRWVTEKFKNFFYVAGWVRSGWWVRDR